MVERRERPLGTNRDMAHHTERRRRPQTEPSDAQLLRQARRDAERWQHQLVRDRRHEQTSST